tara:strand:- start:1064 stop:1318 length:255 start_codon:yes stop_codon:yes gene_type:complete
MSSYQNESQEEKYSFVIMVNHEWKEFVVLKNKTKGGIDDVIDNKKIEELDNVVYGKYFKGCIGYNPVGWWEYVVVKRNEIHYKQ